MEFSGKYVSLYETITGETFDKADMSQPIRDRIGDYLAGAFPEYFNQ